MKMTILSLTIASAFAATAAAKNPYTATDDTWITINGTVQSTSADGFILDYGNGAVTVEMDAPDGDTSGYKVIKGDKVTVSGIVDDDLFETASIEASSVYVENLNTHFFSPSAMDEEDLLVSTPVSVLPSRTLVVGTVTDVDGREFTVNTGAKSLRVDTTALGDSLTDEQGLMEIEIGDRVSVGGRIDRDFFEGRELEADSVVSMEMVPQTASSVALDND